MTEEWLEPIEENTERGQIWNNIQNRLKDDILHNVIIRNNHYKIEKLLEVVRTSCKDTYAIPYDNDTICHTYLMTFAFLGQKELLAKFLTIEGIDVNVKNKKGSTSLMMAAKKGYAEIVELLIKAGADVNVKNESGWTSLMLAIYLGYEEITEMLIKAGAR